MKIDKYSAILGNTVGFHDMSPLTEHRPVASLPSVEIPFDWLPHSSLANAGVRSILGIFQQDNISSVFDHIRSGREWGLSTLLSHYYLGIYNTRVESSTVGKEYYQQLTYLRRSGLQPNLFRLTAMCWWILTWIKSYTYTIQQKVRLQLYIRSFLRKTFLMWMLFWNRRDWPCSFAQTLDNKSTDELFNMSTDIFVVIPLVDWTTWRRGSEKNIRKVALCPSRFSCKEGAFAYEYTGYLANIHSVQSLLSSEILICLNLKIYSFLTKSKIYTKVKNEEPTLSMNTSK